jgi:hypothetical protein
MYTHARIHTCAACAESGFPEQATASRDWNTAMGQWEKEGVAAPPGSEEGDKYPPLASGAALTNPQQLGLSALALQALARNPAAGVTGPVAGAFGGSWTQSAADSAAEASEEALARPRAPGAHSAYYGSGAAVTGGYGGHGARMFAGPARVYLAAKRSLQQQLKKKGKKGKKGKGKTEVAAPSGPPFTNGKVSMPTTAPREGTCAGGWSC